MCWRRFKFTQFLGYMDEFLLMKETVLSGSPNIVYYLLRSAITKKQNLNLIIIFTYYDAQMVITRLSSEFSLPDSRYISPGSGPYIL